MHMLKGGLLIFAFEQDLSPDGFGVDHFFLDAFDSDANRVKLYGGIEFGPIFF